MTDQLNGDAFQEAFKTRKIYQARKQKMTFRNKDKKKIPLQTQQMQYEQSDDSPPAASGDTPKKQPMTNKCSPLKQKKEY